MADINNDKKQLTNLIISVKSTYDTIPFWVEHGLAHIDYSWWCIDIDSNDLYCATCGEYVKDHNAMKNCPKCGLFMTNTTESNFVAECNRRKA